MPHYATVWEFTVPSDRAAEFERHYGPAGAWAELFGRAPGYRGTLLLHHLPSPMRYVTIDRWTSREAYRAFRETYRAEYERLDTSFAGLATSERHLGEYDEIAAAAG